MSEFVFRPLSGCYCCYYRWFTNVSRNPKVVNQALIDFAQQMRDPDEVVVTILQSGDTFDGRDFCFDLDDNLVSEGAVFDIADTKTFAELQKKGLINAMLDAIIEARNNQHPSRKEKHLKAFYKYFATT